MQGPNSTLGAFAQAWAVLLTTYRRDGRPVDSAVSVVVDGDRLCFRTYAQSGKFKRLQRDSRVRLQPCDARGNPTGEEVIQGEARLLQGPDDARVGRLIDTKHRFFQAILVRSAHRLRRYRTVHFAVPVT